MLFVCSHIVVSRSGMPVGRGVVRQIGDCYQVVDGIGVSESDRDTGMCDCSSLKSIMQTLDLI